MASMADVEAAMELTKDMHFALASKVIAETLNVDLKTAYDLVMICIELKAK